MTKLSLGRIGQLKRLLQVASATPLRLSLSLIGGRNAPCAMDALDVLRSQSVGAMKPAQAG